MVSRLFLVKCIRTRQRTNVGTLHENASCTSGYSFLVLRTVLASTMIINKAIYGWSICISGQFIWLFSPFV